QLAETTGLPMIELDKLFWGHGLVATPRDQWVEHQRVLVAHDQWILDGDLGPYDVLELRLQAADTVIFLDYSPLVCVWRAMRRGPERLDFWLWLLQYRRRSRPLILQAMDTFARHARHYVLRTPAATRRFLASVQGARITP
ncbi:MAG TPA: hypothetical protein VKB76_17140, partial [Ktedonobacterales bacterium]|nr:hypothetical protein [Ktedonobacterales bacterium]